MSGNLMAAYADRIALDPAAPLITYYDQHSGERTELSGTTAANWISKTANYFIDELLIEPGNTVALALPPHWQTFVIAHACWHVGAAVCEAQYADNPDVLFCGPDRMMEFADATAGEIVVSSLDPMGRPVAVRPDHVRDYTSEVRVHGDQFTSAAPESGVIAFCAADSQLTQSQARDAAAALAQAAGVSPGDRVLADARTIGEASLLGWALMPVVAGASLVLVRPHPDADAADWVQRIAEQEQITTRIGEI